MLEAQEAQRPKKNHVTSQAKRKVMQPLNKKNPVTSSGQKKNHATSQAKKIHATSRAKKRSCNLSGKKKKNHATSQAISWA